MPTRTDFSERNPANRPDPSEPVAEAQWEQLPKCGAQLSGAAFMYEAQHDQYRCPMGRALTRLRCVKQPRSGIAAVQYQCPGKADCPLADKCVRAKAAARIITRDQYQGFREQLGRRMATPEGRAIYKKRAPVVEGVFAEIKHAMGIRRFLVRGLHNVRIEWNWICLAFNLKRLIRFIARPTPPTTPSAQFKHQTASEGRSKPFKPWISVLRAVAKGRYTPVHWGLYGERPRAIRKILLFAR